MIIACWQLFVFSLITKLFVLYKIKQRYCKVSTQMTQWICHPRTLLTKVYGPWPTIPQRAKPLLNSSAKSLRALFFLVNIYRWFGGNYTKESLFSLGPGHSVTQCILLCILPFIL